MDAQYPRPRSAIPRTRWIAGANPIGPRPQSDGYCPNVELCAFGHFRAVADDGRDMPLGRPKQRLALAVLIAAGGRTVPAERLLTLLWDDDGEKQRAALHSYVSN